MAALLRLRGWLDYHAAFAEMQAFTAARTPETPDEIWLCQHPPVFTQGQAGKAEHVRHAGNIPVVQTDRGGQVTYHGPGQVVAYPLIDLRRAGYFVKELVWRTEEAVLQMLADVHIVGTRVAGAPGIYVPLPMAQTTRHTHDNHAPVSSTLNFSGLGKIAALGLKVHQGCSYHGVALNVAMDLEPFSRIHPCGYTGLHVVDMASYGVHIGWEEAAQHLGQALAQRLAPS